MEAIKLCDQPECNEAASNSYTWDWGQVGVCCSRHIGIMQQTAKSLERTVSFAALSTASPPLQREERVRLRAEALVLTEELTEAKERGLDLYRQNTLLTQQVQSLTVRNREAEAQRKDAIARRDEMDQRLRELESENATLSDELQRLRVLVDMPPQEQTQPGTGPSGWTPSS